MTLHDDHRQPHLGGPSLPEENTLLLVWDAPNLDMGLGALLGGRPSSQQRPRFDAVGRWLLDEADALTEDLDVTVLPEATVFTNVNPDGADIIRPWVDALRNVGFAVFAKPKSTEDSDVDPDMLDHIRRRHAEGCLRGLVVASADGQNFKETLEDLAEEGIPVTVLGFHEHASWAVSSDVIEFIDLEDIPQVFLEPLPRIGLDHLPDEGAWLQPFRSLAALRSSH
ncbi:NYN domain-containing protein [Corynebacterium uropygiale]|uniref:NYN domain-containing protein n=1 Tax=Corynebacterium uropygiale TaxID=1775911 RepID=A0A9X1U196_9CORY|nr:NYN domain-containing protein [Corynebacterium uropygiale]MCF4007323.1 NYN domain-containing protein [Corynebacterium uropygiale]